MTADIKEIKRKIAVEWQNALPQLSLYSVNKFYKIVGPVIIGLELVKLPGEEKFRPYFVIYSLWGNRMGNDLKACLAGPIILQEYKNKKGFQFNIPYDEHDKYFREVLESIKQQTPLLFSNDISLNELFSVIDKYAKTSTLSAAPNSFLQASLQEAKLEIALYVSTMNAQKVLGQINNWNWNINQFNMLGVDLNTWLDSVREKVNNRSKLLSRIIVNIKNNKIMKLKISELKT